MTWDEVGVDTRLHQLHHVGERGQRAAGGGDDRQEEDGGGRGLEPLEEGRQNVGRALTGRVQVVQGRQDLRAQRQRLLVLAGRVSCWRHSVWKIRRGWQSVVYSVYILQSTATWGLNNGSLLRVHTSIFLRMQEELMWSKVTWIKSERHWNCQWIWMPALESTRSI